MKGLQDASLNCGDMPAISGQIGIAKRGLGQQASKAASYGSSAEEVKDVQARLTLAKASGYPIADLFSIWGDYNSAVESAPIYPPGLYKRHRDELNRLWNNR